MGGGRGGTSVFGKLYEQLQQQEILTLIPRGRQYSAQNNLMSIKKLLVQKIKKIYNPKAFYLFQKVASGIFFEKFILNMASR